MPAFETTSVCPYTCLLASPAEIMRPTVNGETLVFVLYNCLLNGSLVAHIPHWLPECGSGQKFWVNDLKLGFEKSNNTHFLVPSKGTGTYTCTHPHPHTLTSTKWSLTSTASSADAVRGKEREKVWVCECLCEWERERKRGRWGMFSLRSSGSSKNEARRCFSFWPQDKFEDREKTFCPFSVFFSSISFSWATIDNFSRLHALNWKNLLHEWMLFQGLAASTHRTHHLTFLL